MCISFYTTIYFFIKKLIFLNVYFSLNMIFECLYMFPVEKGAIIKYVRNWLGMEGHTKCVEMRIGGGVVTPHVYVSTRTISFHIFGSIFFLSCLVLFVEI